ncbi:hypothetical protein GWI33_012193 [Rhynchophorus ferrugineus]|uniref:Uncharacterized protein n=1 Tax=Rhynchophorus ferrugineus TaxID=354439 RepID=A0A834I987_RHYFE|nr:hypothetical protein GWI33_012193 [Rhynchophorus ferrugineus]
MGAAGLDDLITVNKLPNNRRLFVSDNWPNDPYCHPHHRNNQSNTPPSPTTLPEDVSDDVVSNATTLTRRLEQELRAAKRTHLSCGEVLLPCSLLQRVSASH